MDMLQIYVVFSFKTIIHVQYFNIYGHAVETCPFRKRISFTVFLFFSRNKIITVRQTIIKGSPVLWSLSDNNEFGKIMSGKLWQEVENFAI